MNGAESLVETLAAGGVEVCFANPGTSEMHFVAALDRTRRMRCVLALFEGVVSAAADGYGRMAGKPACTLLHLAPGFGNAISELEVEPCLSAALQRELRAVMFTNATTTRGADPPSPISHGNRDGCHGRRCLHHPDHCARHEPGA